MDHPHTPDQIIAAIEAWHVVLAKLYVGLPLTADDHRCTRESRELLERWLNSLGPPGANPGPQGGQDMQPAE